MKKEINGIPMEAKPKCLLVGNGINLLFDDPSWKKIIKNELDFSENEIKIEDICHMPATMQIVVVTKDHVNTRMQNLSEMLMNMEFSPERVAFLQRLLSVPVDDILTTNYSFELEIASGMKPRKQQYSSGLQSTFPLQEKHRKFRLFQFYEAMNKRIWHIHGDVAKPETMLMGHYYYAKHLKELQECIAKSVQRYKICERQGDTFKSYSWVDQFLTGDVYILGLGMYLCESDLWYLLCCKKRNFPDTRIYFYDKDCKDKDICIMLKTYGVEVICGDDLDECDTYKMFYDAAFKDIETKLKANSSAD